MDVSRLTRPAPPWSHLLAATAADARSTLAGLDRPGGHATVRFVRGYKATTTADLFDELAAALQFSDYFGENWDALVDCLSDQHGPLVLVVTGADRLLVGAGDAEGRRLALASAEVEKRLNYPGAGRHAHANTALS